MTTTMRSLTVHSELVIVEVEGYEPEKNYVTDESGYTYEVSGLADQQGDANWLCDSYGMCAELNSEDRYPGILWTDYDAPSDRPWLFNVLIDGKELHPFQAFAKESGYSVLSNPRVKKPQRFGDGNGCVEILEHREGWVVVE